MESITFENHKSARILSVNVGAPTQAAALIRQQNLRPAPMPVPSQRAPMQDRDMSDKDDGNPEPTVEEIGENEG
jgi:hypothetical protein